MNMSLLVLMDSVYLGCVHSWQSKVRNFLLSLHEYYAKHFLPLFCFSYACNCRSRHAAISKATNHKLRLDLLFCDKKLMTCRKVSKCS